MGNDRKRKMPSARVAARLIVNCTRKFDGSKTAPVTQIISSAIRLVRLEDERDRRIGVSKFTRAYAMREIEPLQPKIVAARKDLACAVRALRDWSKTRHKEV